MFNLRTQQIIFYIASLTTLGISCASSSRNPEYLPVISEFQFCDYFGRASGQPSEKSYYNKFVTNRGRLLTDFNSDAPDKNLRTQAREYILKACALQLTKNQFESLSQKMKTCIAQELFIEMVESRRADSETWKNKSNILPSSIEKHFRGLSIQHFVDHDFPIIYYPTPIAPEYRFSWCEARLSNLRLSSLDGLQNIPDIEKCDTIYLTNNALKQIPPYAFSNFGNLHKIFLADNPISSLSPLCFVKKHSATEIQDVFVPLDRWDFLLPGMLATFTKSHLLKEPAETVAYEAILQKVKRTSFRCKNQTYLIEKLFTTVDSTSSSGTHKTKQSQNKKISRKKRNRQDFPSI